MEDYINSSKLASKHVTKTFSNSFSNAITLFDKSIRQDIYNIYGLVRIADEIVDTYQGEDAEEILDSLEKEVYDSLVREFSSNVIVYSFVTTANRFKIDKSLIKPFFDSMRMDLTKKSFTQKEYKKYIYGSSEVVGLMCLKVFIDGNNDEYIRLRSSASALGSAFQKVNFLRDLKDDFETRGRYYFPVGSYKDFNSQIKSNIVKEIEDDFASALSGINKLPKNSRLATRLAFNYYTTLLSKLKRASADQIKSKRLRVSRFTKLKLLVVGKLVSYV